MKNKILEVASEIFAEKGYQNTTIRDICQKADIYQLSINYHFGSKENLFKEVLYETYMATGEIELLEKIKNYPPEQQLEEIIRTRLHSIFDKGNRGQYFKIIAKEMSNNYDLIVEIMCDRLKNYLGTVRSVFAALGNNKLNDFELNYCVYLLISHISAFCIHDCAVQVLFNTKEPSDDQLEAFTQHVKKFILAGVNKIKEEQS